jgi:hypothetical protein
MSSLIFSMNNFDIDFKCSRRIAGEANRRYLYGEAFPILPLKITKNKSQVFD